MQVSRLSKQPPSGPAFASRPRYGRGGRESEDQRGIGGGGGIPQADARPAQQAVPRVLHVRALLRIEHSVGAVSDGLQGGLSRGLWRLRLSHHTARE
jgi:hypothetical protein